MAAVEGQLWLGPQLRETLSRITEEAAHLLAVEGAGLRLVDGAELVRVAIYGPAEAVMTRERLRLGESLSGQVAATGQALIVGEPETDPTRDEVYQARAQLHGFRSWLGVPLRQRDHVVGVLVMQSRTPQRFGPTEVRLLEAFAGQAAVAIENARLYERERERRRQLEAVREVTARLATETDLDRLLALISRSASDLLEVDSVAVYLWDEATARLVPRAWHGYDDWLGELRLGLSEGVAGTVAQARAEISVDDYRHFPAAHPTVLERTATRAVIGEPLLHEGELRGVITASIQGSDHTFSEQDRQLLTLFAAQASIAIEHARLHEARRRALAEAEVQQRCSAFLAETSAVLASSLDYQVTLQQVAWLAVPEFADWCTVYTLVDGGEVRRVATACANAALAELAEALRRYPPSPVSPRSSVAEVMRTGQSVVIPEIPNEYIETIAQDAEHLEIMRKLAFRSSLVVPLSARGEVLGALALFLRDTDRRYSAADLPLLEDLAGRAAQAIDHARLFQEAQQAVQARDEFLSVAAHELKTPVTALLGFAQVLLQQLGGEVAPKERVVQRALRAIERQSNRLAHLVAQLLDVSRIEGGKLVLECVIVDLTSLVQGAALAAQDSTDRHTLVVQAPSKVSALVDPLRLEQVLTNLLDNAIKYSPQGGPIEVELVQPSPGRVRLSVRDRGIGIPPEMREQIFNRFYQAHSDAHISGIGLGLYISRQIVELHGGELRAEFPDDGGSRFIVDLPTAAGEVMTSHAVETPA